MDIERVHQREVWQPARARLRSTAYCLPCTVLRPLSTVYGLLSTVLGAPIYCLRPTVYGFLLLTAYCSLLTGTALGSGRADSGTVPASKTSRRGDMAEELLVTSGQVGRYGGRLVVTERSEPKTLNPIVAADSASREVIQRMTADLIHINRESQRTEPALAKSWEVSRDGLRYTLDLRRGVKFSDGQPFDADDVVFSFEVYLDEKVHSPQRDLLVVGEAPIAVRKLDAHTVEFRLAKPYAAAERLFDGVAILPRHSLEKSYLQGTLNSAWGLTTPPDQIAGLGPFRLKKYVPGERLVLERNPYYWKADRSGNREPYLNELDFLFVPSQDAQALRFQAGESDVASRLSAEDYAVLERSSQAQGYRLYDLGPGLEYNFLFFNLNDLSAKGPVEIARRQAWFEDVKFRQAVSAAIDREAIVRLVYQGRGVPLWGPVTPGNKIWLNTGIPRPPASPATARHLLQSAGFSWKGDGSLVDAKGAPVEFSIITSAGNSERTQMATMIQNDLSQLGISVHVLPLEFRALLDRVFRTHDYEACILGLGDTDVDPNPEMNIWLSSGGTHVWNPGQSRPATAWEAEMDSLMREQLSTLDFSKRKRLYDRVQELVATSLPVICIAGPDILVGAKSGLGNFRPAILDHYTLWNIEELYWRDPLPGVGNKQSAVSSRQ
jgi:peptide/nickel transport system substrate-binding protein